MDGTRILFSRGGSLVPFPTLEVLGVEALPRLPAWHLLRLTCCHCCCMLVLSCHAGMYTFDAQTMGRHKGEPDQGIQAHKMAGWDWGVIVRARHNVMVIRLRPCPPVTACRCLVTVVHAFVCHIVHAAFAAPMV